MPPFDPVRPKRMLVALALVLVVAAAACGGSTSTPSPVLPGGSPTVAPATSTRIPAATDPGPAISPGASATSGAPTTPGASNPSSTASASGSLAPTETRLTALTLALEPFVTGLESPVLLTHAGDGSGTLYVIEQPGRIRTLSADGTLHDQPFLDIAQRITAGGEQGLLGLAFHPEYRDNGRFYVDYSDLNGDQVISEFVRGTDGRGDPASERRLIFLDDFASNHNGGMLAFGPDGDLYIGMGDGGGAGDPQQTGQDTGKLFGKVLRISVEPQGGEAYGIPAGNPFARSGGRPEVWDHGLRNPWRFSFDRLTGDLFIADVGQGTFEEIDVHPAGRAGGLDFGWSEMEGPECFRDGCHRSGMTLPVTSYRHDGGACSVTGGYVYRGSRWPMLQGIYLYGDYCSGTIWGIAADSALTGTAIARELLQSGQSVSSFGEDAAGELYLLGLGGSIFRVTGQ